MQSVRRALYALILVVSLALLALPLFAQQVIVTVPVGSFPWDAGVNPVTNKIYITNRSCLIYPYCLDNGTVTVIDGVTNNTLTVNVGVVPVAAVVNSTTNRIYVANECGDDLNCLSNGTVTVIDGATNNVTATLPVGRNPVALAVNSVTNKIYVANASCSNPGCDTGGTVTVIDGATNHTLSVNVGYLPSAVAVDPVANKIYVSNLGVNAAPYVAGTVTVIDGDTNHTLSVNVGILPHSLGVNPVTNKIYVANKCGDDPQCGSTATVTMIDGATLATAEAAIGGYFPYTIAVNSVTNKIYVPSDCSGDPSCLGAPQGTVSVIDGRSLAYTSVPVGTWANSIAVNPVANTIYVANQCGNDPSCLSPIGTVTVIDGRTLAFTNVDVGYNPYGLAVNSVTNRIYVPNSIDNTVSVIAGTPPAALQFVPLSQPCRAVDTRPGNGGNGPIPGGSSRGFPIPQASGCNIPATAAAYSLNLTVVPSGPLGYLTIWPTGEDRPLAATLNSLDGRIKANAAIVPAGYQGSVSIYVTHTTNVVVDVNGYFAPVSSSTLAFYPLPPCRVADTRKSNFPQGLGPPFLNAGQERAFPILNATSCNIPSSAAAYSMNFSVVPHGSLFYMTVWPTGENRPTVSTLNDVPGQIIANAAIVVAGTNGNVSVYPTNDTDLIIDINGYFAPAGPGGLSLYAVAPCRVIDTRHVGSGQPFSGPLTPPVNVSASQCEPPATAQAYVFNASVVPVGPLGYLSLWPDGASQPLVSTLNALDGSISSNMAIVPTSNGSVDAYASGLTQLILDISSYFAP